VSLIAFEHSKGAPCCPVLSTRGAPDQRPSLRAGITTPVGAGGGRRVLNHANGVRDMKVRECPSAGRRLSGVYANKGGGLSQDGWKRG